MVEQYASEQQRIREDIYRQLVEANPDSGIFPDLSLTTPTPEALTPDMASKIDAVHKQYADAGLNSERAELIADEIAGRGWFLFQYASRDDAGKEELIEQVTEAPGFLEEIKKLVGQGMDATVGAMAPDLGLDSVNEIGKAIGEWATYATDQFEDIDNISPQQLPPRDHLLAMAYETLKAERAAYDVLTPQKDAPQASMGGLQQGLMYVGAAISYVWNNLSSLWGASGETDFNKILDSWRDWALEGNPAQDMAREWDGDLEHRLAVQAKARDEIEGMKLKVSGEDVTITPTLARQLTGVDSQGKLIDRRLPGMEPDDNPAMAQAIAARYAKENPSFSVHYNAMADKYSEEVVLATGLVMTGGAMHIVKPAKRTAQVAGVVTGLGGKASSLRGRFLKVGSRVVPFGAVGFAGYEGFRLYSEIWNAVEEGNITAEEAREIQYTASVAMALDPTDLFGGDDVVAEQALTNFFGERTWQLVEKAGLVETAEEVVAKGAAAQIRKSYEALDRYISPDPEQQAAYLAGSSYPAHAGYDRSYASYDGIEAAIHQYLDAPDSVNLQSSATPNDTPAAQVIKAIYSGPFKESREALESRKQDLRANFEKRRLQRFDTFLSENEADITQEITEKSDLQEHRAFNQLMLHVGHQLGRRDGSIDNLPLDSIFEGSEIISTYFDRFQNSDAQTLVNEHEKLQEGLKDLSTDTKFQAFLREQVKAIDAYQSAVSRVNAEDRASGADQSLLSWLLPTDSRITQARGDIKIPQSLIERTESQFYDERKMMIDLSGRTMGPARRELFFVALANGLDAADFHEQLFKYQSALANKDLIGANPETANLEGYFISGDNEGRGRVYIEKPSEEAIKAMHFRRNAQEVLFRQVQLYEEHIATHFNAAHFEIGLVERMQQGETISDADIDQVIDQLSPEHIRRALGLKSSLDQNHPTHNITFRGWAGENGGNRRRMIKSELKTNIIAILRANNIWPDGDTIDDLENMTLTNNQWQAITKAGTLQKGLRDHLKQYLTALRDSEDLQKQWVGSYEETAMAFVETTAALKPFAQDLAQAEYAIRDLFMFPNEKELGKLKADGHYNTKWEELINAAQAAQNAFKDAFGQSPVPADVTLLLSQKQYDFFTDAFSKYFKLYSEQYLGLPEQVRSVTQQGFVIPDTRLEPGAELDSSDLSFQQMSFNGFSEEEMHAMLRDAVYGPTTQGQIHHAVHGAKDQACPRSLRAEFAAVGVWGGEHQPAGHTPAPSEALPTSLTGGYTLDKATEEMRRMV